MDDQRIRDAIFNTLQHIAPEVEPGELVASEPLRDQVDLDSMDWLGFMVGLDKALGIDIPEADYRKLNTLEDLIAYLRNAIAPGGATRGT